MDEWGHGAGGRWKPASASGGASPVEESVRGAIPGPSRQAGGVTIGLPGAGVSPSIGAKAIVNDLGKLI